MKALTGRNLNFNPRFPRGKRQDRYYLEADKMSISIHASRGGSDECNFYSMLLPDISIHASRGGSDVIDLANMDNPTSISIHASRGGSDTA